MGFVLAILMNGGAQLLKSMDGGARGSLLLFSSPLRKFETRGMQEF
jgi:hypothetical protein